MPKLVELNMRRVYSASKNKKTAQNGLVAQLVEQGTLNPWVVGSIPTGFVEI